MRIDGKYWVAADFSHLRIPKQLLEEIPYRSLSPEGKLLYGAMLDRTNLSHKNRDKFTNREREIYIFYPQAEIMDLLGCGHDKASKVLDELEKMRLIKTRRRGIGRPYEIVLIPIDWRAQKNKNEQPEKPLRDSDKSDHSLCGKVDGNNTDINNYESNNSDYYLRNYLKHEIGYDELTRKHDPTVIDRILDVAVNTLSQEVKTFQVRNNPVQADLVKEKLRNLRKEQILYVIRKIKNATYTTDHSDAFILNALYESAI